MSIEAGMLVVGVVAAGASLATALVLWVTLRGVLKQAESMTEQSQSVARLLEESGKQAKLTAEVLDDQRRQRTLDLALRFHTQYAERNSVIGALTPELSSMTVDKRVERGSLARVVPLLNWLAGYGVLCRADLVPNPDPIFGAMRVNIRRFLVAAAYNIDHARSSPVQEGTRALTGLKWFEEYLGVDIHEESRKAQTLHPPTPNTPEG